MSKPEKPLSCMRLVTHSRTSLTASAVSHRLLSLGRCVAKGSNFVPVTVDPRRG